MKTKEQVRELFDSTAKDSFASLKITGGTSALGWDQDANGFITLQTAIKIAPPIGKLTDEQLTELLALFGIAGNTSANGQRLFSSKTTKATTLATELLKSLKR